MSYSGVEFQFALEMIIANRNASGGATLRDIQGSLALSNFTIFFFWFLYQNGAIDNFL